jgi:hypothetical protein
VARTGFGSASMARFRRCGLASRGQRFAPASANSELDMAMLACWQTLVGRRCDDESSCRLPPLEKMTPLAVPPDATSSVPPPIVVASADPPELTISSPPPKMSVPLDRPPRSTVSRAAAPRATDHRSPSIKNAISAAMAAKGGMLVSPQTRMTDAVSGLDGMTAITSPRLAIIP